VFIKIFRFTVHRQSILETVHAKRSLHAIAEASTEHPSQVAVNEGEQLLKVPLPANVSNLVRQTLFGPGAITGRPILRVIRYSCILMRLCPQRLKYTTTSCDCLNRDNRCSALLLGVLAANRSKKTYRFELSVNGGVCKVTKRALALLLQLAPANNSRHACHGGLILNILLSKSSFIFKRPISS
jgi:hypothetical protein